MSCTNGTSPIDISMRNITGECILKCSYTHNYVQSNSASTNQGDYISLSYNASTAPPVQYNNNNYVVNNIRIYFPSLHSFNGKKTDGEFIIVHTPVLGGNQLLVCIPIKQSSSNSKSSSMLSSIISDTSAQAPSVGENAQLSEDIMLNKLIPKKPYFTYSGTLPYQTCDSAVDFIVFNVFDYSLDIGSDVLKNVKKIITSNIYAVKKGPKLFYNPDGPNANNTKDDQIYIKCQPTGSSGTKKVIKNKEGSNISLNLSDDTIWMLINGIIFMAIIFLVHYLLKVNNSDKPLFEGIMNSVSSVLPSKS